MYTVLFTYTGFPNIHMILYILYTILPSTDVIFVCTFNNVNHNNQVDQISKIAYVDPKVSQGNVEAAPLFCCAEI